MNLAEKFLPRKRAHFSGAFVRHEAVRQHVQFGERNEEQTFDKTGAQIGNLIQKLSCEARKEAHERRKPL